MNKLLTLIASLLCAIPCAADIIRSNRITSVLSSVKDARTLVIFDIDQTMVGRDGKLMEPALISVLQKLKRQGNKIIALTARPWKSREFTVKQLQDLGISFVETAITEDVMSQRFHIPNMEMERFAAGFAEGILYCGFNPKGKVLAWHLLMTDYEPTSVVFIDDVLPFVESVDEHCRRLNIPCTCIHYQHSNEPAYVVYPKRRDDSNFIVRRLKRFLTSLRALVRRGAC
jgi:hypothetical protein